MIIFIVVVIFTVIVILIIILIIILRIIIIISISIMIIIMIIIIIIIITFLNFFSHNSTLIIHIHHLNTHTFSSQHLLIQHSSIHQSTLTLIHWFAIPLNTVCQV